jgi:hypothetical protein
MVKTSIRLPPEICKKLESEARRLGETGGVPVTVSDLIRACIVEHFPRVSARARKEKAAPAELLDEVFQLKQSHTQLAQDLQNLVQTLTEKFLLLASREQIEELSEGIAVAIKTLRGK